MDPWKKVRNFRGETIRGRLRDDRRQMIQASGGETRWSMKITKRSVAKIAIMAGSGRRWPARQFEA